MKILMLFALLSAACTGFKTVGTDKKIMTDIKEIEKRSEIKFNENSAVLFQEDELGGHQQSQSWIIFSMQEIIMQKGKGEFIEAPDAEKYLANFQRLAPEHSFGELKSPNTVTAFWETKDGNWQGTTINTSNGYYLTLEWVKQN